MRQNNAKFEVRVKSLLERADEAVRDAELALQAMQAVAGRTHPIMQSFWEALAKIKEAVSFLFWA